MTNNLPLVVQLPDEYSVEIGRILVRWAYIEWRLHQVGYRLLDIDPATGRLAMRDPRATEYVDMIVDLLSIYELSIPAPVPKLRASLNKWGTWRNLLAHGVWVQHPTTQEYMVQNTGGQWHRDKLAPGERLSREILTEAETVTVPLLKQIVLELESMSQQLEAFYLGVDKARHPQMMPPRAAQMPE
jgi:hypothetical protein